MGAQIAVDIPEDELGTIETAGHSIAWCVIEMCSPWVDGSVEIEDFKSIPSLAMKTADKEVPQTSAEYAVWRHIRHAEAIPNQPGSGKLWLIEDWREWGDNTFNAAREFLRQYGASVSTEDARVEL
ncbi:hypothetical protein [Burkholderia phage FLC9]|nr:hypothetical protein [Burkholderia phage FLC9]